MLFADFQFDFKQLLIINQESEFLYGLFILLVLFGFLLNFIALKIENRRLTKIINYLACAIVLIIVIYGIVKWLI
jgi:hypothetical protein